MESGSLANVVEKFGVFPESLVVFYIEQVLHGLQYLHINGVAHRDIKGPNLLITKEGIVKLAGIFKTNKKHFKYIINTHFLKRFWNCFNRYQNRRRK